MKETQESIVAWAKATFGDVNPDKAFDRMMDEFGELMDERQNMDDAATAKEFIDVFITGVRWLDTLGIDFQEALDAKMAVNRARRWRSNGDGTGQHIPEGEP